MKHNIVRNDGEISSVLVVLNSGKMLTATPDHHNFTAIVAALAGTVSDAEMTDLFDVSVALAGRFDRLSERVMIGSGHIYFDGEPVHDALADAIVTFHSQGQEDYMALVNFMEKIATNPSENSRNGLFDWLVRGSYSICPDGDFIGYKSVNKRNDKYLSVSIGTAIVNGVTVKGAIPTYPDSIVEMPRGDVTFDPNSACAAGLHVGTWDYARSFSGNTVVLVKVNPRDVVSVPRYETTKLRCCRYRVLGEVTAPNTAMLYVPEKLNRIRALAHEPAVLPSPDPAERSPEPKADKPKPKADKSKPKADKPNPKAQQPEFPKFYEQFSLAQLRSCTDKELRWLAKEYELTGYSKLTKENLVKKLRAEGLKRQKTW